MRFRVFLFVLVLVLVAGVGVAMLRGAGPLPDPEGCAVVVGDHTVMLSTEQAQNASIIAAIGVRRGLPARAVSIALATAYQESKIRNLGHGDRDSLGIFQQRPSMGWGTEAQVQDPYYATNKFYDGLVKIPNYQSLRITEAAQKVQRSGFPEAYEAHAEDARALASALTGYSPGGSFSCVVRESEKTGTADEVTQTLRKAFGKLDVRRTGARQDLEVRVRDTPAGHRRGWAVSAFLVAHGTTLHPREVSFDGGKWTTGRPSEKGWQPSPATPSRVRVGMG